MSSDDLKASVKALPGYLTGIACNFGVNILEQDADDCEIFVFDCGACDAVHVHVFSNRSRAYFGTLLEHEQAEKLGMALIQPGVLKEMGKKHDP